MVATASWTEFNGTFGADGTDNRTDSDWKSIDDSTTDASDAPVLVGSNSYSKVIAVQFGGTWGELSNLQFTVDSSSAVSGATITGSVLTFDPRPLSDATNGDLPFTAALPANFAGTVSPWGAGTDTVTGGGVMYSQALRTQLQTSSSSPLGYIPIRTITASWVEA